MQTNLNPQEQQLLRDLQQQYSIQQQHQQHMQKMQQMQQVSQRNQIFTQLRTDFSEKVVWCDSLKACFHGDVFIPNNKIP